MERVSDHSNLTTIIIFLIVSLKLLPSEAAVDPTEASREVPTVTREVSRDRDGADSRPRVPSGPPIPGNIN